MNSGDLLMFEGIFALYDKNIRDLCDMKIFLQVDNDIRIIRRSINHFKIIISK